MAATNYPSFLNPYGFSTQYQLRFGVVVGHDPERHAVHVSFRDTMEYVGYSLPVLNSWADGYYVEQKPLPKKGTLVLCAFPMGDDRNGVVIGALYGSNLSAITQESSGYNPYTDYVRYPNNIWKMADSQANITWVHPSGMYFNINTGGTSQLQPTYNVVSSENPNLTETQSVPSVPQTAPPYFYFSHPSGASFEIDPSGDLTTSVPGTFNETVVGNFTQTYKGTLSTQVTGDVTQTYGSTLDTQVSGNVTQTYSGSLNTQVTNDATISSGSQLTTQVGTTTTTLTSSSSSTTAGGVTQEVSSSGISGNSGGATFMDVTAAGAMTLLGAVAATGFTIGGNSVVTSFNGQYGAITADLNTLGGVNIANPVAGQVLTYNGTNWVNYVTTNYGFTYSSSSLSSTSYTLLGNYLVFSNPNMQVSISASATCTVANTSGTTENIHAYLSISTNGGSSYTNSNVVGITAPTGETSFLIVKQFIQNITPTGSIIVQFYARNIQAITTTWDINLETTIYPYSTFSVN